MTTIKSSPRTLVLFRRHDLDAFIAAFIYWWCFGKDSVRPTDTIVPDAATINFRSVDVFENVHLTEFTHTQWTPSVPGYIGSGETILSIGINLPFVPAASAFFSYENDTTFEKTYEEIPLNKLGLHADMPEGCKYYYDPLKPLSELMFESLMDAGHFGLESYNFRILNQFFQFYDGKGGGFSIPEDVTEKLLTYFPQLRVEDFKDLDQMLTNSMAFYEARRKVTPEDAVRSHVLQRMAEAMELSEMAEAYKIQTGIDLRLVNSEQAISARPLLVRDKREAMFVYRFVKGGVRGHYISSDQGENALAVFPQGRPVIGCEQSAEWFISVPDFYSLSYDLSAPPKPAA